MKIEKEIKGLAKSFTFAFRGIQNCILSERNMRIHIVLTVFVILFSLFYDFSRTDYILLALSIAAVLSIEMMNTALEAIVDLVSPSYNKIAQVAKDIAAGAVLISAICSVAVGILLFFDLAVFHSIFVFFQSNVLYVVLLIVLGLASLFFIFKGTSFSNKNKFKGKS